MKLIVWTFFVLSITYSSFSQTKMIINKTDGTADSLLLSDIKNITFKQVTQNITTDDKYVLNTIMPSVKIVERIKIGSLQLSLNQSLMIASGYNNCTQIGDFVVYIKNAQDLDPVDWTAESGTAYTGDHLPSTLQIEFAWKSDGTVYMGALGDDNVILASIAEDGRFPSPNYVVTNQSNGLFFEGPALRQELKSLSAANLISGLNSTDSLYTNNFDQMMTTQIFNRFPKPIYFVFSEVVIDGPPSTSINNYQHSNWDPFNDVATGTATRSFTLSITNPTNSYVLAEASNDNGNSSYVKLDGSIVAQMTKWTNNYYRRTNIYPRNVELGFTTIWSAASPHFSMAVVCDNVTVSGMTQNPVGGISNNRSPIIYQIPVYTGN